ncbi:MAG: glycosyltransferase [Candidatus Aenigmarchaeota archaeon]|nr:glycosyltransferase [Candidatus Aenigmarchaeota archaeon]
MISIIIPAYNEEKVIEKCITSLGREIRRITRDYEIIIVEESNDRTPEIVEKLAKKSKKIIHIHSNVRLGKGGAIERGVQASKGSKIIFMDADLSTDLSYLNVLISKLDEYDLVIGSRYHPSSKIKRTFLRLVLSKIYSALFRIAFGLNFRDIQCGFKGFTKKLAAEIIPQIHSKDFFWDTELVYLAKKNGFRIREIEIEWKERKGGIRTTIKMVKSMLFSSTRLFFRRL